MIVCSCNRLTDSHITEAICAGASMPAEIYAACGCQPNCGRCAATMSRMLGAAAEVAAALAVEPALAET